MKQVQDTIITGMPSLLNSNQNLMFDDNWPIIKQLPVPIQLSFQEVSVKKNEKPNYSQKGKRGKKLAWNCQHKNKMHYAKGVCQTCYLSLYYQVKAKESMII